MQLPVSNQAVKLSMNHLDATLKSTVSRVANVRLAHLCPLRVRCDVRVGPWARHGSGTPCRRRCDLLVPLRLPDPTLEAGG